MPLRPYDFESDPGFSPAKRLGPEIIARPADFHFNSVTLNPEVLTKPHVELEAMVAATIGDEQHLPARAVIRRQVTIAPASWQPALVQPETGQPPKAYTEYLTEVLDERYQRAIGPYHQWRQKGGLWTAKRLAETSREMIEVARTNNLRTLAAFAIFYDLGADTYHSCLFIPKNFDQIPGEEPETVKLVAGSWLPSLSVIKKVVDLHKEPEPAANPDPPESPDVAKLRRRSESCHRAGRHNHTDKLNLIKR